MARRNINNETSEWIIVIGVVVAVIISLSVTLSRVNVWQIPPVSDVEAPQLVLEQKTGKLPPCEQSGLILVNVNCALTKLTTDLKPFERLELIK